MCLKNTKKIETYKLITKCMAEKSDIYFPKDSFCSETSQKPSSPPLLLHLMFLKLKEANHFRKVDKTFRETFYSFRKLETVN